jgi:hypothetical protein
VATTSTQLRDDEVRIVALLARSNNRRTNTSDHLVIKSVRKASTTEALPVIMMTTTDAYEGLTACAGTGNFSLKPNV